MPSLIFDRSGDVFPSVPSPSVEKTGTGAVDHGNTVAGSSTAGSGSANHQSGGGAVSAPRQIARTLLSQRNYKPVVW